MYPAAYLSNSSSMSSFSSIVELNTPLSSQVLIQLTTTDDNVGSFGLMEMDERWMEIGERLPLSAVSKQRRTSLPTGGFVGVHVCFEEMPPRRHHSLTMSKYFPVSTYCYSGGGLHHVEDMCYRTLNSDCEVCSSHHS